MPHALFANGFRVGVGWELYKYSSDFAPGRVR